MNKQWKNEQKHTQVIQRKEVINSQYKYKDMFNLTDTIFKYHTKLEQ